ncbi:MAG: hypothetical protein JEY97_13305 [Bacteroidales bacterium]|nr:hypothetical protein [Bacteroidales bacterium]
MDDFLYILIGAAWLAFTIYSKNQKQKYKKLEGDNSHAETGSKKEGVSSLFDSLFSDKEINVQQDHYTENIDQSNIIPSLSEDNYSENIPQFKEEPPKTFEKEFNEEDIDNNLIKEEIINGNDIDFNLRKAVIYSEILKRPYN